MGLGLTSRQAYWWAIICVWALSSGAFPQTAKRATAYPKRLPYAFSNFVWWSNDEIRALLKKRIPGLGDEIAPTAAAEGRIRDGLKALLRQKGIVAEVQSEEPSNFALSAGRAPGAPEPAIVFSVLSPRILTGEMSISHAPEILAASLKEKLRPEEGQQYSGRQDWIIQSNAEELLKSKGYLDAHIEVFHGAPRPNGDHYVVNQVVSIKPGPQYHVSSITADGGPLLQGRDLSRFFVLKPGDVAAPGMFGQLPAQLQAYYSHYGYADVAVQAPPVLDRPHALVSYHLKVIPGPIYHLRSLTIHNLNAEQEQRARELLAMKPGGIFDGMAINGLFHKVPMDSLLSGHEFSYIPMKDKATDSMDLTLDFYRTSNKSSVTVH